MRPNTGSSDRSADSTRPATSAASITTGLALQSLLSSRLANAPAAAPIRLRPLLAQHTGYGKWFLAAHGISWLSTAAYLPLLGWLAGQTVVQFISKYDHWVAFALLAFVGIRMILEFIKGETGSEAVDIGKWATLLTLALATSIDALAVGLSFALLKINIIIAAAIIGAVAFSITAISYWLGRRVSAWIGRWALLLGAIILIGIGLRILFTHMVE